MGSVYRQTGRTHWMIKYYRDGRAVVEATETDDKQKARRILRRRETDLDEGKPIEPTVGRLRFDEAVTDVLNDYIATGKTSQDDIARRIRKHLTPVFGGRRLSTITPADIRAYIAQRLQETYRVRAAVTETRDGRRHVVTPEVRRPYSKAQINRELMALNRIFTLAIETGKVLYKPHVPKLEEHNARAGFFDLDQFEAVRRHLPAPIQAVVTFAFITGWRITSEILPLEWRNVDFASGEVRLDRGTSTKNREGRVFVMTDELRALLLAQRDLHVQLKKATPPQFEPWVFFRMVASERGGPKAPRPIARFEKTWNAACVAAGCPGRIPHDLRRSAIRNMVRAGVPERVAMKLTGHKTRSIFERYNIVSDSDLATAAVRLSGQFTATRGLAVNAE